jgi:hypothetical protein
MSTRSFVYSRISGINIRFDLTFPDAPDAPGESASRGSRSREAKSRIGLLMERVNQMMEGQSANSAPAKPIAVPAVVFFHGGGLTAGNREFYPRDFKGMLCDPFC